MNAVSLVKRDGLNNSIKWKCNYKNICIIVALFNGFDCNKSLPVFIILAMDYHVIIGIRFLGAGQCCESSYAGDFFSSVIFACDLCTGVNIETIKFVSIPLVFLLLSLDTKQRFVHDFQHTFLCPF